jgi:hypothetical protein
MHLGSTFLATMAGKLMAAVPAVPVVRALNVKCAAHCFFSSQTPFFSYTSGRSRRKQRLELKRRRQRMMVSSPTTNDESSSQQKRTVLDMLFPDPYRGQKFQSENDFEWPTSFSMGKAALSIGWKHYRGTWNGFLTSRGFLVEDKNEDEKREDEGTSSKWEDAARNLKQNVNFLENETEALRKKVRQDTGISSAEDLKRLAGDMMRLASDCVKEFMSGYRKGRDDEVEMMLTRYLNDLEVEANKPKTRRRKPKRRIIARQ